MKKIFLGSILTVSILFGSSQALASTYTVKSGDTLWRIATTNNITVNQITELNNLNSTLIYPGQALRLFANEQNQQKISVSLNGTSYQYRVSPVMINGIAYAPVDELSRQLGGFSWVNSSVKMVGINKDSRIRIAFYEGSSTSRVDGEVTPMVPSINQNSIIMVPIRFVAESLGYEVKWNGTNSTVIVTSPNNIPSGFEYGSFPLPVGTYKFLENYADGRSWNPDGTSYRKHEGVDLIAPIGTPIYSVLDGTISNIGWNQYGGWRITIKVDNNKAFYYAHMSKYADGMKLGLQVKKGQIIGYVGDSGYGVEGTTGQFDSHLHFGIYETANWTTIDPTQYLKHWELNSN